jgi:putative FmdB family regulatory protein
LPVYEYRCTKGHRYEKTEGFDAPSSQKCIRCGGQARRQISMPAVIFKGSGFYSTDNRKSGWTPGESASDSSSSNGSSGSKKEKKAEAATAD